MRRRLHRLAEEEVEHLLGKLPPEIRLLADRVTIHLEDKPDQGLLDDGFPPDLLGVFEGDDIAVESLGDNAPPRIRLFLDCLWDWAEHSETVFREEVRITLLHELGHYLGWDETDIAERGLE